MKLSRRHLFGGAAVGTVATLAGMQEAVAQESPAVAPFTPLTVPHLLAAEQMVSYQRLLAAGFLPDGLVGHWALDGSAADASGNNRDCVVGSGASWTALRAGGELSFNGMSTAYAATTSVLDTTTPFTVSAWVRLGEAALLSNMYTAVSQDGQVTSRFLLQHDPAAGWTFKVRSENEATKVAVSATKQPVLGVWTHLAGVSDGTTIKLYVDGVLVGEAASGVSWQAAQGFSIGRAKYQGNPVNRWNGSIDDVRAYQRALSAAEVEVIAGVRGQYNNFYTDGTSVVWGQPGDVTSWISRARCSSFMTRLLKYTYPWATDDYFRTYFAGDPSPEAAEYRAGFAGNAGAHFRGIRDVRDLRPGDLIAVDYMGQVANNTGHIVMVRQVKGTYVSPYSSLNFAGETQYAVEIVDCTADPHGVYNTGDYASYPDTRMVDDIDNLSGVGIGHMMFYASNTTGEFTRYRWSVNTSSSGTHTVASRPIAAARVV